MQVLAQLQVSCCAHPGCLLFGPAGQVRQLSTCCERILLENQLLRQQLQMHQGQMGLHVMGGQQMRVNAASHLLQVRVYTVIVQPIKMCICPLCDGLQESAALL